MANELELIGELQARVERLEGMYAAIVGHRTEVVKDDRPHFDRVMEVLHESRGQYLTASEIAHRAGIDPGSARMVLYTNKSEFRPIRVSPARVKWQVNKAREETALAV